MPPQRTLEVWISTDADLTLVRQEIVYTDPAGEVLQRSSIADGMQVTRDMATGDEYASPFAPEGPLELPWLAKSGLLADLSQDGWEPKGMTTLRNSPAAVFENVSQLDNGLPGSYTEVRQHVEVPVDNSHLGRLEVFGTQHDGTETIVSSKEVLALETVPTWTGPEPLQPEQ